MWAHRGRLLTSLVGLRGLGVRLATGRIDVRQYRDPEARQVDSATRVRSLEHDPASID